MIHRSMKLLGFVAALLIWAGCDEAEEGRPFQVVAAERQTLSISAVAAGVLEPVSTVDVKSKASGEIVEVAVETGDQIEAGQLLVQVERADALQGLNQAQADLDVARARLKIAESQLERSRRMIESNVITEQEFEAAELEYANSKAQLVRAEAALEVAKERMAETTIRAPIDGTIIEKSVEAGQVISSATREVGGGTLLMRMANLQEVQVRTLVDETDIGRVQPGLPAEISVEAYREQAFRGRVLKIEPQATVQQNVTMFPVIIRIENRDRLLKPGMSAEVTIQVARSEDAITVPAQAVHPPQDARDVARLALGIEEEMFGELLAQNRPQESGSQGSVDATNGDGPPQMTQAQRDSLRERFRSGQMSPEETRRLREQFQRMRDAEGAQRPGAPREGIVFAMREQRIVPVPVRTGVTDWENIEILSGLEPGDSVALLPTASLLRDQAELLERFQRFRGGGVPGMRREGS